MIYTYRNHWARIAYQPTPRYDVTGLRHQNYILSSSVPMASQLYVCPEKLISKNP